MGRKAGVTADETRTALLQGAAEVFARKGYDGASIADITSHAGLSSGAIYAHYESKAELFLAVVKEHGRRTFADLFGGGALPAGDTALLIEALVSSRRHPEVEELLATWLSESESQLTENLRVAQRGGKLDPELSAEAAARFLMMVSIGSHVIGSLSSPPVDHGEWTDLIARVVRAGLPK